MAEIVKGLTQFLSNSANGSRAGFKHSELSNMIDLACNSHLLEPDMAMNLEICDMVKAKEKSAPREATVAILEHVHSRNLHESMLALELLDCCVKNCDFGFHFQVASKDFLNELFKHFPDRPPPVRSPIQEKILELLVQWNIMLYETSKYKSDFVHINDMYRLLLHKGYHFPELKTELANVLKSPDTLKTRDELERDDKKAQEAKLQELIRRGTPVDLQQANDLMKQMAGYYHDKKPNYELQESEEFDRIEERSNKLKEMLKSLPEGTDVANNDSVQELISLVKTSQPKITKWIQDNAEDDEKKSRLDRMLFLNDLLCEVTELYEKLKKQSVPGKTVPATVVVSQPSKPAVTKQVKQEASLIDLDDFASPSPASAPNVFETPIAPATHPTDLLADLSGISFSSKPQPSLPAGFGKGGAIQLSPSNSAFFTPKPVVPVIAAAAQISPSPVNWQNGPVSSSAPVSNPSPKPSAAIDPFESLISPKQSLVTSTSPSLPIGQMSVQKILFDQKGLKITVDIKKKTGETRAECHFSNSNSALISQLSFQVAAPSKMALIMESLTGTNLPPNSTNSAMQCFVIKHAAQETPRIRFKIQFSINNTQVVEQGEYQF